MEEKLLEVIGLMNERMTCLEKRLELLKKMIDVQNETIDLLKEGYSISAKTIEAIADRIESD